MTQEELFDIYDDSGLHIGVKPRSEVHRDGDWHRVFHCWIIHPDGYILMQQRHPNKDMFPNKLDITAAGHYSAGETTRDGVREIKEEVGITVVFEELISLGLRVACAKEGALVDRQFCDEFFYISRRDLADYRLQVEEVIALVAVPIEDGIALFKGTRNSIMTEAYWRDPNGEMTRGWRAITRDMFIETVDPYALKIFLLARRWLQGETDLYI